MKIPFLIAAVTLVVRSTLVAASAHDENSAINSYTVPVDAERSGPAWTRERDILLYTHFLAGAAHARSNIVAEESFFQNTRVSLELFRNARKHGVQREWFRNGRPKSESPYKDGLMHGIFRQWDGAGNLVAEYKMTNGSGTIVVYGSDGLLARETEIKNNLRNGRSLEFHSNGRVRSVAWFQGDRVIKGFGFRDNGSVRHVGFGSGPFIYFQPEGSVEQKIWRANGSKVTEAEYKRLAAADFSLIPYYEDASRYKQLVDDSVKAILEKYRNLPPVKIPLELGADGNPLPASGN